MEIEEVSAVHSMLHLVFHRNKNQHGRTRWWKWLSILKRLTLNLAKSLEQKFSLSYGENDENDPPVDMYKRHLAMHVVPRCYLEFSTVVADGQFSTIGTVLLAALARLVKATGTDRDMKILSQAEKKTNNKPSSLPSIKPPPKKEDVGEVVNRTEDITQLANYPEFRPSAKLATRTQDTDTTKEPRGTADMEAKVPKKKKRKKNAIDDLFAGIL